MNQTRVMQRSWGMGLVAIGVAGLVGSRLGDSFIVSVVLDTLLILIAVLLPLPPGLEARIRAWPFLVRAVVLAGAFLAVLAVGIVLSELVDPLAIPISTLGVGAVLWFWSSRAARR